ncbi:HdeD family acid-resistance protein [Enterococcus faecalis]|nr:hypothetical protein [Enterococcus faecalis]
MERKQIINIDWGSLVLGILFIFTSLISFFDPSGDLIAIVIVFAIFAFVKGIFELFVRNRMKCLLEYRSYWPIFIGIIDILIGVSLFLSPNIGLAILPFIFAVWFLIESILELLTLDLVALGSRWRFGFAALINSLGIFLGLFLLFNPITSALTLGFLVGFYFMMFGISNIVYAFR